MTAKIERTWVMPNKWTFKMEPVRRLLSLYDMHKWIDPFAGVYSPAGVTNDIVAGRAQNTMDALDFLRTIGDDQFDGALFDPPYSVEQCLRKYTPRQRGTAGRAEYWAKCKDEIKRIVTLGGTVISFAWDSNGMGKNRGFEIDRILLLCHGACHNDTIITVETKVAVNILQAIKLSRVARRK